MLYINHHSNTMDRWGIKGNILAACDIERFTLKREEDREKKRTVSHIYCIVSTHLFDNVVCRSAIPCPLCLLV